MSGLHVTKGAIGLCVALAASSAWADSSSPFVGRWHWNPAQSTLPPGQPAPSDVTAEISRADSAHLQWSLTVRDAQSQPNVETFDAPANGEFYSVSGDTTAAFRLSGSTLQGTFKGPSGRMGRPWLGSWPRFPRRPWRLWPCRLRRTRWRLRWWRAWRRVRWRAWRRRWRSPLTILRSPD